jgi:hypothetical protein
MICPCARFTVQKYEATLIVSPKHYQEWFDNIHKGIECHINMCGDMKIIHYDKIINAIFFYHINPEVNKNVRHYLIPDQ